MSWLDQLGGLLQQYANPGQASQTTEQDFDNAASIAPREAMSQGLAEAFRSDQTPPFPSMLGQLFANSNGVQQASILNTLLSVAGPALMSGALSSGGLGSLGGLLGRSDVSEQEAAAIPQKDLEELARTAEKHDPSIIDRVSEFYSEHPGLVKSLGAAALAVAMSGMAKEKRGIL